MSFFLRTFARSLRAAGIDYEHNQLPYMTKEHKGVIYILTNPSFKEYVKARHTLVHI